MKGLDTPLLLALLEGNPKVRTFVRKLAGHELATTEANVFELEALARSGRAEGRERRLQGVERLRRRLTVLPIDESAVRRAAAMSASSGPGAFPSLSWLILGAIEARGGTEWVTSAEGRYPRAAGKLRVRVFGL